MFQSGEGVAQDTVQALALVKRSAEGGSAAGQHNLARRFEYGEGVRKDSLQALYWYEQSDATRYSAQRRDAARSVHTVPQARTAPSKSPQLL